MSVEAAILKLQSKAGALTGMKAAPDEPPESINVFPFTVSFEDSGSLANWTAQFGNELVVIVTQIHVSRQLLAKAIAVAYAYRDSFIKAVMSDPTLGGSVSTITAINWRFGRLAWGGIDTIGYEFRIGIKVDISP